jgi:prevent-host-death family protein
MCAESYDLRYNFDMDTGENRRVRSDEARARFSTLIDEVTHEDAHIYVLRYDKPVAVIVPVEWYEQARREAGDDR